MISRHGPELISIVLLLACLGRALAAEHPFLVVKAGQFEALRAKAEKEPWKSMKADALARASAGLRVKKTDGNSRTCINYARYLGACALAHVLDPDGAAGHARRVREAILTDLDAVSFKGQWEGAVPPCNAVFMSIIALDTVHGGLDAEARAACEKRIEAKLKHIRPRGAWPLARYGAHGTWAVYRGKRTGPDDRYFKELMSQITADGVTTTAVTYAWARLGGHYSRTVKAAYMDVLEFTGLDRRYYRNAKLREFHRWLYALAATPARQPVPIGDTILAARRMGADFSPLTWRAGNFGPEAGAAAAWFLGDARPPGHILAYVLPRGPLPEPRVPGSRLFPDGGAWFRRPVDDPDALMAVLYNIKSPGKWHAHKETNGLALAGRGERLLVNGGWLGPSQAGAARQNTLTVGGRDHRTKRGGGLTEGLIAPGLDYACGAGGPAIADADWRRSLCLVHPGEGTSGYVVVCDEVRAKGPSTVTSFLHPATESPVRRVGDRWEYEARIDHHALGKGVRLGIYYVTRPTSVTETEQTSGYLRRMPKVGRHRRLAAAYGADDNGRGPLLTLLVPRDAEHGRCAVRRLAKAGASGAVVDHGGGVADLVLAGPQPAGAGADGVAFDGRFAVCRRRKGETVLFFVRKGVRFAGGSGAVAGFASEKPVSIVMAGRTGRVVSPGTRITFLGKGLQSVRLDEKAVETAGRDADGTTVLVPAGTHAIELGAD